MRAWLENSLARIPRVAVQSVRRVGPIGLEIGVAHMSLCQLGNHQGDQYPVLARNTLTFDGTRDALLDSPELLKKLLRRAVRGQGFKGNRLVTALPPDRVRFTPITVKADDRNLDQAVLKMVADRVDGSIDDYVVDYLPVRSNDEDRLALAAVARREHVLGYLDALAAAGFVVEALDIGPAAIRRALTALHPGGVGDETTLVINTGQTNTYLSVIAGRRLLFDQAVDFGEQALLHKLADNLDLSIEAVKHLIEQHGLPRDAQVAGSVGMSSEVDVPATLLDVLKPSFLQLVEEINRVLVFTASETRGRPMERIVVLGGLARWAGFPQVLCSLVGIHGHSGYGDLEACFDDQSRQQDALFPEMAVALGLALRGLVEDV